jgi:uncharacterized RDD family membrane protein YckC
MNDKTIEYAGFWVRFGAFFVDFIALSVITMPLTRAIYGRIDAPLGVFVMGPAGLLINFIGPAVLTIVLWVKFGGTLGKIAISAKIVNADTGESLSTGWLVARYLGYFLSLLPLGLGFLWIAFDPRKQGWHDKIANSVVIRPKGPEPVRFSDKDPW